MYTQTLQIFPTSSKNWYLFLLLLCSCPAFSQKSKTKIKVDDIDGIRDRRDSIPQLLGDTLDLEVYASTFSTGQVQIYERLDNDQQGQLHYRQDLVLKLGQINTFSLSLANLPSAKQYVLVYAYGTPDYPRGKTRKFDKPFQSKSKGKPKKKKRKQRR